MALRATGFCWFFRAWHQRAARFCAVVAEVYASEAALLFFRVVASGREPYEKRLICCNYERDLEKLKATRLAKTELIRTLRDGFQYFGAGIHLRLILKHSQS